MKVFVALLATLAVAQAGTAFGYLTNVGIPKAEQLRIAENNRLSGGSQVSISNAPWQAGLLGTLEQQLGTTVCGGSLVSSDRVVTAAFCYWDGTYRVSSFEVVLGSDYLFYGGVRLVSDRVVTHPDWNPVTMANNIAVIYLPLPVAVSDYISPVALPSGSELSDSFYDNEAFISGYGSLSTGSGISTNQILSGTDTKVVTNLLCSLAYSSVSATNICTSGDGGVGLCSGDFGSPLVTFRTNRHVLIGVGSYFSSYGCEVGQPSVFSRVTAFVDFITENL